MIELNIAACSVNKYYRNVGNRVCISADGRIFKKKIDLLLNNYEKTIGKIKLTLHFYFQHLKLYLKHFPYPKVLKIVLFLYS